MSRTIVLELFLPFRLFKKTANIRCTTTSAQILNSHENKTKWRIALKRKTGAAAKHLLIGHLADWTMEPWNHGTIEPSDQKISRRSRIWVLPADARQQKRRLYVKQTTNRFMRIGNSPSKQEKMKLSAFWLGKVQYCTYVRNYYSLQVLAISNYSSIDRCEIRLVFTTWC